LVTDPAPDGLALTLSVYRFCVKLAVTFFGPLIVNVPGFVAPVRSPVQFEKAQPPPAVAEIETLCPALYQLAPDGFTVPVPEGTTEEVRLY
jgi:hypothetical protein